MIMKTLERILKKWDKKSRIIINASLLNEHHFTHVAVWASDEGCIDYVYARTKERAGYSAQKLSMRREYAVYSIDALYCLQPHMFKVTYAPIKDIIVIKTMDLKTHLQVRSLGVYKAREIIYTGHNEVITTYINEMYRTTLYDNKLLPAEVTITSLGSEIPEISKKEANIIIM